MMLQEGGSHQTEQQMSEMIKENLTLSVKKGKPVILNRDLLFFLEISSSTANQNQSYADQNCSFYKKKRPLGTYPTDQLCLKKVINYYTMCNQSSHFLFASFFCHFTQLRIKSSFVKEESTFCCLFQSSSGRARVFKFGKS